MSYSSYPSGNSGVKDATSNDQDADEVSPYKKLEMEVAQRVYYTCIHEYSTAGVTLQWRNFWNEKMCLLWLKSEGIDWPEIITWFEKRGFEKNRKALHSLWTRVSNEMKAMQTATKQYEELSRTAEALAIEPPDPWDSISNLMGHCGAKDIWTPGKVKYAWHHGASTLLYNIHIVCKLNG